MTHLRVSPKLHKAIMSEGRQTGSNQLLTLASYGAQNDPDVIVLQVSVAPAHSKGSMAAARFDPVMNGCTLRF